MAGTLRTNADSSRPGAVVSLVFTVVTMTALVGLLAFWSTASAQVETWEPAGDIEDLSDAFAEASAATRTLDGLVWTVDDSEITIHSWARTDSGYVGTERADLSGTVADAEGITALRSLTRFAVLDERNGGFSRITFIDVAQADLAIQTVTLSDVVVSGGNGAEAIAYSFDESTSSTMVFYVGIERTRTLRRYEIDIDPATNVIPASELSQTNTGSWTLTGIDEISGLADDPGSDMLYIVDEAGSRIARVVIGSTTTTELASTVDGSGTSMDQPEGIFFNDCLGSIDIIGESNGSTSQYLRFDRDQSVMCGDVNCDGQRNVADALWVAQFTVGNRGSSDTCPVEPFDDIYGPAADFNIDGDVTVADALLIAQCTVGIPRISCENPVIPDALADLSEEERAALVAECLAGGTNAACPAPEVCDGLTVTVNLGAGDTPTAGDDVILGTDGDDVISASTGNDVVCAGDGADMVIGGDGDDVIFGGPGNDVISGNGGDDVLIGDGGSDRLFGGSGNDRVEGRFGNDTLGGGSDADIVLGAAGNDVISGGSDDDTEVSGGDGNDAVNGGGGDDDVTGGSGDDTVSGNGGEDTVDGGFGNDAVRGGQADDLVLGGDGDDQLFGNTGFDVCIGGTTGETLGDTASSNCEVVTEVP